MTFQSSRVARILVLAAVGVGILALGARRYGGDPAVVPVVPDRDDWLVERLPTASGAPRAREARRLRQSLAASPGDPTIATRLARMEIEDARITSDPRHLGRAQAVLQPWWAAPDAPPAVLILRATIRQARHDFLGALADLDRARVVAADEPQTWLTRSVVLTVLGRYPDASQSCQPLWRLTSPLVAEVCRSSVDGLTGHAPEAAARLKQALAMAPEGDGARPWATSVLADLTAWGGDLQAAERLSRAVVNMDPDDSYTRAQLSDLLIDQGRYAEVIDLLAGREANDGLLLRLAIAGTTLGSSRSAAHVEELSSRFEAARARGDALHGREEARFQLVIRRDPTRALSLAVANWQVQHEPADARILLEAAAAAGRPSAAGPAVDWLRDTGFQDPTVRRVAARLSPAVPR